MKTYVYSFGGGTADGDGKMKDVLGGKGAGLAEMCRAGVPVPPGFTISTEVCNIYFENGNKTPDDIESQTSAALAKLEKEMGRKLGDKADPLLVSVRSGAKFSMPGMEKRAPERTLTSSGFLGSPSFLPICDSSFASAESTCWLISAGTLFLFSK